MRFPYRFTTNSVSNYKRTAGFVLGLLVVTTSVRADVCVWRDPERTMQRIFPSARDYKTTTVKMTPEKINSIEKAIGMKLDESEKSEFSFYRIMGITGGKPKLLGTIIALAGKGEYGVVEVVIGVDGAGKILGAYIQRSRERVTRDLESPLFLQQFKSKTIDDAFDVGSAVKSASPEAEASSRVVAFLIRKMLVFYNVLSEGESKQ